MAVTESAVEREVRIAAPREVVFPYFVDPALMVRWKGVECTLDPNPGGVYRVDMNGRNVVLGEYVEIEPPERVVFTWGWEGDDGMLPPGASTVEITLVADGDDTIVRLCHRGLAGELAPPHAEGWDHYLERLVIVASGGNPGRDPWLDPPT